MQPLNFDEVVDAICTRDVRYHHDAYYFVREALDFTQRQLNRKPEPGAIHHVSCKELLHGLRDFALQQFGPLAQTVLEEWGVHRCEDFGELVFNMIESSLLAKTEQDSREEFRGVFDFQDAFRKPFLPAGRTTPVEAPPSSAQP